MSPRRDAAAIAREIVGAKIVAVDLHPFDDGRGGEAHAPMLHLSNGGSLSFVVQETDAGEYGVLLSWHAPPLTAAERIALTLTPAQIVALRWLAIPVEDRPRIGPRISTLRILHERGLVLPWEFSDRAQLTYAGIGVGTLIESVVGEAWRDRRDAGHVALRMLRARDAARRS